MAYAPSRSVAPKSRAKGTILRLPAWSRTRAAAASSVLTVMSPPLRHDIGFAVSLRKTSARQRSMGISPLSFVSSLFGHADDISQKPYGDRRFGARRRDTCSFCRRLSRPPGENDSAVHPRGRDRHAGAAGGG